MLAPLRAGCARFSGKLWSADLIGLRPHPVLISGEWGTSSGILRTEAGLLGARSVPAPSSGMGHQSQPSSPPPPGLQAFGRKQVLSATLPWGAGSNDVLVWVLEKQTLNKQIREQVVYLAGDPKEGRGEERGDGRDEERVLKQVNTSSNWQRTPVGSSQRPCRSCFDMLRTRTMPQLLTAVIGGSRRGRAVLGMWAEHVGAKKALGEKRQGGCQGEVGRGPAELWAGNSVCHQ